LNEVRVTRATALRFAGFAAMAATLAGCGSAMTYGTGKSPGVQTVEDIAGIVSLGAKKKEQVDYTPRAPIVAPPTMEVLPPPGSGGQVSAVTAANWPNDPDEEKKRIKQQRAEAELYKGAPGLASPTTTNPNFKLPKRDDVEYPAANEGIHSNAGLPSDNKNYRANKEIKKMFADARGGKGGSFDADGHPVRKYLTEPPVTYREPDPDSPVEVTEKPKKKKKFHLKDLWPF
jgi:hypothetical protein